MANRLEISDEAWRVIQPILVAHQSVRILSEEPCWAFLEAVLWVLRSGAPWRLLPVSSGQWNSVCKRCSRWWAAGVWESLPKGVLHLPDVQSVFIDSTVVRAHPGAAGRQAKDEALGRSRGGFSPKVHAITEALGNPRDFVLAGGPASDIGPAESRLELTPEGTQRLVGAQGSNSDGFIQAIQAREMEAVIPPRRHRHAPRQVDGFASKERHLIECFFFNKIKPYRRICSGFEKLARNYMSMLRFVSALIWLR